MSRLTLALRHYVLAFVGIVICLVAAQFAFPDAEVVASPRTRDYSDTGSLLPLYFGMCALPFALLVILPLAVLRRPWLARALGLAGAAISLLPALILFETPISFLAVAVLHFAFAATLPSGRASWKRYGSPRPATT